MLLVVRAQTMIINNKNKRNSYHTEVTSHTRGHNH